MGRLGLLVVAFFMSLCCCEVWSQQRIISVDELFRLIDTNSKSIRISENAVSEAAEAIQVAKTNRLPSLDASLSFSYLGNGRIWDRNFTNGAKAAIPHYGNNFSIEASQVIYSGGAISAGIELAELQHKIMVLSLQENKQNIRFLILGYYLELYKLNNQHTVYQKNIEQTKLLVEHIRARNKEGLALQNDITRYELQLQQLHLALTEVENNIHIFNYQLASTLDLPKETIIVPDSTLLEFELESFALNDWQQEAAVSQPHLKIANASISLSRQQERITRSERLPKVAFVAANHLDAPITIEVPPINKNFNYWYVGVGVQYSFGNLWKSNKKSNMKRLATLRAEQNYDLALEEAEIAVNSAYVILQQAYEQVRTQQKSVELASQNYRVINNRYLNDLALITDMIDASNSQLSAELMLVNAQINVIYNYYKLQRVVGVL